MSADLTATPVILGVSLKMYFGYKETLRWCEQTASIADSHPAIQSGLARLFVLPSAPTLGVLSEQLAGTKLGLGAQDFFQEDQGPFTGAVSGKMLKELGCDYVEIGHAERREIFGETDLDVAAKIAAALRNDLTPVLCVGEEDHLEPNNAAQICIDQIESAVSVNGDKPARLLVAYEPIWAIGAEKPASESHIILVCQLIKDFLASNDKYRGSRVIYGGSAGPGLLTKLQGAVAGLFLGRFALEPENLKKILDEVSQANSLTATPGVAQTATGLVS